LINGVPKVKILQSLNRRIKLGSDPIWMVAGLLLTACATQSPGTYELSVVPAADTYCLDAQRVVTRTTLPMTLVVHSDFDAFVKSKTNVEGADGRPEIHQFNWYDDDGNIQGISCKMKSADHLNITYGEGSAGPDGYCQDMNRQVYNQVLRQVADPVVGSVTFDLSESLKTKEQANMIGPAWIKAFTMTYLDEQDGLHVATKGFVIDFTDQRYLKLPARWRGTHYCHLIAPDYLSRLLQGEAEVGAIVGAEPTVWRAPQRQK
jgi:hypothetical protein